MLSLNHKLPLASNTACWGNVKLDELIVILGVGVLLVPSAESCAGVNSKRPGFTVPPAATVPPSITHRSPAASNTTPCGAPKEPLLFARCGAIVVEAGDNCEGMNSQTLVPFATHSALFITGGVVVVGDVVELPHPTVNTIAIAMTGRMVRRGTNVVHRLPRYPWSRCLNSILAASFMSVLLHMS